MVGYTVPKLKLKQGLYLTASTRYPCYNKPTTGKSPTTSHDWAGLVERLQLRIYRRASSHKGRY